MPWLTKSTFSPTIHQTICTVGAFVCDFGDNSNPKECAFKQVEDGRRDGVPTSEFDSLGIYNKIGDTFIKIKSL